MLKRVAQHYAGIQMQSERKYRILAEAQRKGHAINFDVLYRAKQTRYAAITQEIGEKEGEYIRLRIATILSVLDSKSEVSADHFARML